MKHLFRLAVSLFALCPIATSAETVYTETVNGIEWKYTKSNGCSALYGHWENSQQISTSIPKTTSGDISIPGLLGGCPVTEIKGYAFYACSSLTSVSIPSSVTKIGRYSFVGCSGLNAIHISDLETWCKFDWYYKEDNPCYYAHHLFLEAEEVTSLVIPDSVTSIGRSVFSGCSGLTSVTIPDSVTSIGWNAFYGCSGLTSITIPDSVTEIGEDAFGACDNICDVSISGNYALHTVFGFPNESITNVTIHLGTTSIASHAFYQLRGLKSVTIPDDVGDIGEGAFQYCFSLKTATIPNSITNIGLGAFSISGLETLYLPRSFYGATSSLGIPSDCSVYFFDANPELTIVSNFGIPSPEVGQRTYKEVTDVSACVAEVGSSNGMRHVCTGWTGTGSVPPSGTATNVMFKILEDSSITWNWRTDNLLVVSVTGDASCTFGTQWIENGTTATAEIVPNTHLYQISLSGDTNGVTLVGTTLTIPSDGPRNIAVTVSEVKLALEVETAHGTASPTGTTEWSWGDTVSASIATDAPDNGVRYVCTGWTGTGSAPASGATTNMTFTIEVDSTLTWNWRKDNQIAVTMSGLGTCDFGTQWVENGLTKTAKIVPTTHLYTISLSGDTNGVTLAGTTLTIPSDGPRNIAVTVEEVKLSLAVDTAHGTATPAGTTEWSWGDEISANVAGPEDAEGWDVFCNGWRGTGSVPGTGTDTNVTFTIKVDSSIVWTWATNVWIDCSATGFASIAFEPCWTNFGATVVIPFKPKDTGFAWTMAGDTNGVSVDADARTISIPADKPRTVRIEFTGTTRAEAASGGGKPVEWTHGGDAEWFVDFADENDESGFLRSGQIGPSSDSWTEIAVTGPGRLDFDWRVSCNNRGHDAQVLVDGTQWKRITGTTEWTGETIEIGEGEHAVRWNYAKGTTSAAGEDRACLDNVVWRPYVTLAVSSIADHCEPAIGVHTNLWGDAIEASAEAEIVGTRERLRCAGWYGGTGSLPAFGSSNHVSFAITNNSQLHWCWHRDVWIEIETDGCVRAAFTNGWVGTQSANSVSVVPLAPYVSWSMHVEDLETSNKYGIYDFWYDPPIPPPIMAPLSDKLAMASPASWDTTGHLESSNAYHRVLFDPSGENLSFWCGRSCRITLCGRELTLAGSLDTHGLKWLSYDPAAWFPEESESSDGEDAAKSGSVRGDDASVLRTTVTGPGTLAWTWKLSMAGSAGVDVFLDGELVDGLYEVTSWTECSLEVKGDGEHEIRFEFWNAGEEGTMSDCAYLDRVNWNGIIPGGFTETTPVPVPRIWLNGFPDLLARWNNDYEAVANGQGANGANQVWECYVAGLCPTNADERFIATINITGGVADVKWSPDLNEGGARNERVYTVEGKEKLSDTGWTSPTNATHRFFRVRVEMP